MSSDWSISTITIAVVYSRHREKVLDTATTYLNAYLLGYRDGAAASAGKLVQTWASFLLMLYLKVIDAGPLLVLHTLCTGGVQGPLLQNRSYLSNFFPENRISNFRVRKVSVRVPPLKSVVTTRLLLQKTASIFLFWAPCFSKYICDTHAPVYGSTG